MLALMALLQAAASAPQPVPATTLAEAARGCVGSTADVAALETKLVASGWHRIASPIDVHGKPTSLRFFGRGEILIIDNPGGVCIAAGRLTETERRTNLIPALNLVFGGKPEMLPDGEIWLLPDEAARVMVGSSNDPLAVRIVVGPNPKKVKS